MAFKIRKLCRERKLDKSWIRDGIIFVKTLEGRVVLIKTNSDLIALTDSRIMKENLRSALRNPRTPKSTQPAANESFVHVSP